MKKMQLTHSSTLRLKEKQEERGSCQTLGTAETEKNKKYRLMSSHFDIYWDMFIEDNIKIGGSNEI